MNAHQRVMDSTRFAAVVSSQSLTHLEKKGGATEKRRSEDKPIRIDEDFLHRKAEWEPCDGKMKGGDSHKHLNDQVKTVDGYSFVITRP